MQRTSESIATLAAALAKAQIELVNPEKSLVATIRADGQSGGEQTFRYASLSSGLEIVRKILGQHEIATLQTTSIDQAAGIVNLTTMLAHASGEWIASDWPVCPVGETATPHRMGAALTYARRYALFTLVGIAGEDDLDAPDLAAPTNRTSGPDKPTAHRTGKLNGAHSDTPQRTVPRRDGKLTPQVGTALLDVEASADARDRLIAELDKLGSSDDAATWAHRSLGEKNRLNAADALRVEEMFQRKLKSFAMGSEVTISEPAGPQTSRNRCAGKSKKRSQSEGIDKSVLTFSEPRRIRDRDHVKFVAQNPCLICGRQPADAHHLRFAQSRALGRRVSDEFTVPLCRGHHREVHRCGDEAGWWRQRGVDPTKTARILWLETRPLRDGSQSPTNSWRSI
jgi:hypothetical protein